MINMTFHFKILEIPNDQLHFEHISDQLVFRVIFLKIWGFLKSYAMFYI